MNVNHINIKNDTTNISLINQLNEINSLENKSEIFFRLEIFSSFVYADTVLIFVVFVQNLIQRGVSVHITYGEINQNVLGYLIRIGFFALLNSSIPASGKGRNSSGRFIEIKSLNSGSISNIHNEIHALTVTPGFNSHLRICLETTLYEALDNVLNHSDSSLKVGKGSGYVVAQYFPTNKKLRILIADCGVGIHYSLTKNPLSEYKHLSEKDAIDFCTDKGVKGGDGMGFGLNVISQQMILNQGRLIIHSGCYASCFENGTKNVYSVPFWQGTYVFLEIKSNVQVNIENLYQDSTDRTANYYEQYGDILGIFK